MTEYQKLQNYAAKHLDDFTVWNALFEYSRTVELDEAKPVVKTVQKNVLKQTHATGRGDWFELYWKSLYLAASYDVDSYLLYIEKNRKPENRFYQPRRKILRPMIQGYQEVFDGQLDLLTISQPKRTGKSQTGINFVNMVSGRNPNGSTLMEGAGDALVKSFYDGCNGILSDPQEYLHFDVFPAPVVARNADIKTINLEKRTRFPTIMCRSIDATQVGLSEATNLLYLDDLSLIHI